ncbi:Transcription factor GRAS [Dillenia turbinata]|uniref:Transcription factor GRAS n=1 Tax=Dillenia turbinata TaxID=194707 RepID=A0AAN8W6F3_9MAGN
MQESQTVPCGINKFHRKPVQDVDTYCSVHCLNSDNGSIRTHSSGQISEPYLTLESSSTNGCQLVSNSPSTVSFSPSGSPVSPNDSQSHPDPCLSQENAPCSPLKKSCVSEDVNHKLQELESLMHAPDPDTLGIYEKSYTVGPTQVSLETDGWKEIMEMISHGDLKEVLIACAKAVSENDILTTECLISELRSMVSVSGEPIQRLGAYILEGFVARFAQSGSAIYKSLRCKEPASHDLLSYMHLLYEICPYFKFGYMSANGAIAEAMKDEDRVHIIDFQIAQGTQWISLIQALAARPGGPPHICITGIDDSTSAHARAGGLDIVAKRLSKLAQMCNVPFKFRAVEVSASEVEFEHLGIQPGEALAVNFALMLHHMPDESVTTQNPRDRILRMVRSLSPKVVTLVEQESNTNTAPFFLRFLETLHYYLAMFESIDVAMSREHKDRINVEQHCLARDIVNIIACEGAERVERHELLGKWRLRFTMAGFKPYPLSPLVSGTIKTLLANYCMSYSLEERDEALYLGWMNKALIASCAWQ